MGAWLKLCDTPETIQNGEENFCNIQTKTPGYVTAKKCNILITVQNSSVHMKCSSHSS